MPHATVHGVQDRVAVVTGAALGLGKAAAERLAEHGARVPVTDVLNDERRASWM